MALVYIGFHTLSPKYAICAYLLSVSADLLKFSEKWVNMINVNRTFGATSINFIRIGSNGAVEKSQDKLQIPNERSTKYG